jgi:hypothetical protein
MLEHNLEVAESHRARNIAGGRRSGCRFRVAVIFAAVRENLRRRSGKEHNRR